MSFLKRLPIWLSGITVLGSALAWLMALFSGFSSSHVICWGARSAGSCEMSSSPYWTASTILWLSPIVVLLVIGMRFLVASAPFSKLPYLVAWAIWVGGFVLLATFVLSQASGNSS